MDYSVIHNLRNEDAEIGICGSILVNPAKIYDVEKANYEELHDGKEFLSPDLISKIEISAAMIEKNPELNKCFVGGYPEVTVLWTEDGVKFKSRFELRFKIFKSRFECFQLRFKKFSTQILKLSKS